MACSKMYVPPDDLNVIYHICVLACPYSRDLDTPEKAGRWFSKQYEMPGYVEGGPRPGYPGTFAWFFYVDPRLKAQFSRRLLAALETLQRGEQVKIYYGKPNKKGERPYRLLVVSNQPHHRQVTGEVDMEVYIEWDQTIPFQEFRIQRDPKLNDDTAVYVAFGTFDPELIEPELIEPEP